MDDLTISPKDFVAGFSSVQNDILTRYEEQTASLLITVRDKKKAQLEEELKERFQKGFCDRLDHLAKGLLILADKNLKRALKKYKKPDDEAIIEVVKPYIIEFHDNIPSAKDLKCHQDLLRELREKLENFSNELITLATKKAFKIKLKRGLITAAIGMTTIPIGTLWAACTLDPSLLIASVTLTCAAAAD